MSPSILQIPLFSRLLLPVLVLLSASSLGCLGDAGGSACEQDQDELLTLQPRSSYPSSYAIVDDALIFRASHKNGEPYLWIYDGSGKPDEIDRPEGSTVRAYRGSAEFDGFYYFAADADPGTVLARTRGSTVEPLRPGGYDRAFAQPAVHEPMVALGDHLYFIGQAFAERHFDVFRIDRDGVESMAGPTPLPLLPQTPTFRPDPRALFAAIDRLFFTANRDELWVGDGVDRQRIATATRVHAHVEFDDRLYYVASDYFRSDYALYEYDGTGTPVRVRSNDVRDVMIFDGRLYIVDGGHDEAMLRVRDEGDPEVWHPVFPATPGGAIALFAVLEDALYFVHDGAMWRHTLSGEPTRVTEWDQPPQFRDLYVADFERIVYEGAVYFAGEDHRGVEFWRFDGEEAERVADLDPGTKCLSTAD